MRLVAILVLVVPVIRGAERCDVPPQYEGLSKEAIKERLKQSPDDLVLNRLFVDSRLYQHRPDRERYAALLAQHPGDPEYQYFYARALVGSDTKEALRLYDRILGKDPDYPWVRYSQLEISRTEVFHELSRVHAGLSFLVCSLSLFE
jgi:hypothetical protein